MINSLVCVPSPLKKSPPPTPPKGGEKKPLPLPLSQGEGSNMQIDLANTLVCKAYFCLFYNVLFIISPQARPPLLWRGRGRLSPLPREGLGVGFSPSFGGGWGEAFGGGLSQAIYY